jgi:hypothetical protein
MMTEVPGTPRGGGGRTATAVGDGRGVASVHRTGFRAKHGPVTSVAVVPLWDRFRTGARG